METQMTDVELQEFRERAKPLTREESLEIAKRAKAWAESPDGKQALSDAIEGAEKDIKKLEEERHWPSWQAEDEAMRRPFYI